RRQPQGKAVACCGGSRDRYVDNRPSRGRRVANLHARCVNPGGDLPGDLQRRKTAEQRYRAPVQLLDRHRKPKTGQASQQRREGDLRLEARQRRTEAVVAAATEREMLDVFSREVESVRVGKARR